MGLILYHKPRWTFGLFCLWNHISVTINRYWKTYVTGATVDYRRRVRCSMVYLPNMSLFSDLAFDFSLFPCFNFQLRQKYVSMPMTPYSITQNLFSLCPFKICMYQFDSHKKNHTSCMEVITLRSSFTVFNCFHSFTSFGISIQAVITFTSSDFQILLAYSFRMKIPAFGCKSTKTSIMISIPSLFTSHNFLHFLILLFFGIMH